MPVYNFTVGYSFFISHHIIANRKLTAQAGFVCLFFAMVLQIQLLKSAAGNTGLAVPLTLFPVHIV